MQASSFIMAVGKPGREHAVRRDGTTGVISISGDAMGTNFTSTFTTISGHVTVDVSIGDFFFAPQSVIIKAGDTVRRTNNGVIIHTTTSGTSLTGDGKWATGFLSSGQIFSLTLTQPVHSPITVRYILS